MSNGPTWADRGRAAGIPIAVLVLTVGLLIVDNAIQPPDFGECPGPSEELRAQYRHELLPFTALYCAALAPLAWLAVSLRNAGLGRRRVPGRLELGLGFLAAALWVALFIGWDRVGHLGRVTLWIYLGLLGWAVASVLLGLLALFAGGIALLVVLTRPTEAPLEVWKAKVATHSAVVVGVTLLLFAPLLIFAVAHPLEFGGPCD